MNEKQEFDFIKETIKQKPVNKKKLLRRTLTTVSMAVIFGLVACVTFLILEPLFSNLLYPPEDTHIVTFPEDEDEILPEDMLLEEEEQEEAPTQQVIQKVEIEVEDYQMMYTKLYGVYQEVSKSIVTVSGITSDIDWFNNTYENKGMASGLIIANSGKEIIIITEDKDIVSAESICVTFCDGEQAIATVKKANSTVNLVALSIPIANLKATTLDSISLANIGNSNTLSLIGSPVIAVGSPLGYSGSISYGIITSVGNNLRIVDSNYKLITTDIYGSPNASGVLVNLKGQVIGIVHQTDNAGDMKNAVSAIGISELKSLMEKLSNQKESSYLGIYSLDLPKEVIELQNVPKGAYVAEIVMDSPAMKAGIQSGDIIVEMNGETITNIYDYAMILNHLKPDDFINIVVMRQSKQEYQEMNFGIYAGKLE